MWPLCLCVEKHDKNIFPKNKDSSVMQPERSTLSSSCMFTSVSGLSSVLRSVLTVACEQTEVLLFDPISSRHIKTLTEAHEDCVNNIRCISLIVNHPGRVYRVSMQHPASHTREGTERELKLKAVKHNKIQDGDMIA